MIAIIRTRPPFARVEYEPYHFIRWTELFPDKEFIWLTKTPDKINKRFGKNNFPEIKILDTREYFEANTVQDKKNIIDEIIASKNITQLITIHNDIKFHFKNGTERKGISFFENDKVPTFVSNRNFYDMSFIAYHISKTIPVIHIYVDPQEGSWNKINGANENNFFFYENSRINAKYFPFVEWSFSKDMMITYDKKKIFSFGFTVLTADREPLYYQLAALKENINFLVRFPKLEIDNTVKRAEYAQMLKDSKFTLVIPSYEDTDFSSIRFWDAITKGCIPFILDKCEWKQAFTEHPCLAKIIEEDLLVNIENIKNKIENTNYLELLNKIHSSKDWEKLKTKEWFINKSLSFKECLHQTNIPQKIKNSLF
jgi:hypothetical protein